MTIRTNRWNPDTCSCILEYTWDDTVPEASRTHTVTNVVQKCPVHSSLATNTDVWNVVQEENPRKNRAFQHILDNGPAALYDLDTDGITRKLKRNIRLNFSWTGTVPNRVVTLTVTGVTLNALQRNTIQNALNNRFGAGKVILG